MRRGFGHDGGFSCLRRWGQQRLRPSAEPYHILEPRDLFAHLCWSGRYRLRLGLFAALRPLPHAVHGVSSAERRIKRHWCRHPAGRIRRVRSWPGGFAVTSAAPSRFGSTPPTVSCQPLGPGCDRISLFPGGAIGVKGLDAVDSAKQSTNVTQTDIEPPDQGLCAGNGYVVEDNNLGEILVFDTSLNRVSPVIPLDTIMGLTSRGWSSGGDISCLYDQSNGGHWFFTQIRLD